MESEEINDSPLAIDRERDFGSELPPRISIEELGDGLVHRAMAGIDQSVEIAAPPRGLEEDAYLEQRGHLA